MKQTVDIIIIAAGVAAVAWGIYKGLVAQIVSIIGVVIGLWLASKLTPNIAAWLNEYFGGEQSYDLIKICVYVVLFIIILILCKLIGKLLDKVFNLTIMGAVNRILGGVFSLLKVVLILAAIASLLLYATDSMHLDFGAQLKESKAFNFLLETSSKLLPYLKSMLLKS